MILYVVLLADEIPEAPLCSYASMVLIPNFKCKPNL